MEYVFDSFIDNMTCIVVILKRGKSKLILKPSQLKIMRKIKKALEVN